MNFMYRLDISQELPSYVILIPGTEVDDRGNPRHQRVPRTVAPFVSKLIYMGKCSRML